MSEHAGRRRFLSRSAGTLLFSVPLTSASAKRDAVLAVRAWPARDYTRLTLELDQPLQYQQFIYDNPNRLVIDLQDVSVHGGIRELISKVQKSDPYIQRVRIGQQPGNVVRIVLDLKEPVEPQIFTLDPVARYRHRLVIDLHPQNPEDPLVTLLSDEDKVRRKKAKEQPSDPLAGLIRRKNPARRRRTRSGEKAPPAPIKRLVTIAIDAGHGGEDPGAVGSNGTYEKDVVLAIAAELRQLIRVEDGMRALMTREGDYYVPLADRVRKARRVSADLFVSIHADAFKRPNARGASVYMLSDRGATSSAARWLARRENQADRVGGVMVSSRVRNRQARDVLADITARSKIQESKRLAHHVLRSLGDVAELHKPRVERAAFSVLKSPDIPSILVETAFITNPHEERRLASPHYRRLVAAAIFSGLKDYLGIAAGKPVRRA